MKMRSWRQPLKAASLFWVLMHNEWGGGQGGGDTVWSDWASGNKRLPKLKDPTKRARRGGGEANLQQKGWEKATPVFIHVRPPHQQVHIAAPYCFQKVCRWDCSPLWNPTARLVNLKVETTISTDILFYHQDLLNRTRFKITRVISICVIHLVNGEPSFMVNLH